VPVEGGVRIGLPDGLGVGPGERRAMLLLRCLRGIRAHDLTRVLWAEGAASAALARIRAGDEGTDGDRTFLASADASRIEASVRACGARYVLPGEPGYDPLLLRLAEPPPGIFLRGRPLAPGTDRVAVVGTRRPSPAGREIAGDVARHLGLSGVQVISGGAMGIDAVAHRVALDVGARSVAVLGCGIDRAYPRTNRELLARIAATGTLVSEYPPGVPAEPHRFPARNRLIAALSRAVVIVEGAERSGTRLTANHALDLGIDIFAVPGSPASPLARTPLELLRDGARLIRGGEDLLGDLELAGLVRPRRVQAASEDLPAHERRVLEALDRPLLPDAVARRASMTIPEAFATLVELELRGMVRGVGGRFERTFGGGLAGVASRTG